MALIGCRRAQPWLGNLLPAVVIAGSSRSSSSSSSSLASAAAVPPQVNLNAAWRPPKGATTADQSLQTADYFALDRLVSKRQLMEHRVHLGHRSGCRSEWMTQHLFGCRCGVDIIDLEQTAPMLRLALNFTAHVAARGGIVLFFWQGWPALGPLVDRRVSEMGEFAYTRPWVDQVLTDSGNYFDTATRLPDLAVFLSCMSPVMLPHPAVAACAKVMIPTVGICDSNADPRLVTYPVPGNDDSPQAVRLYLALFDEAIRRGKAAFAEWTARAAESPSPSPFSDDGGGGSFRRAQAEALQRDAEPWLPRRSQAAEAPPSPLRLDQPPPQRPPPQRRPQLHQRTGQHQRPEHRHPQQRRPPPPPRDER